MTDLDDPAVDARMRELVAEGLDDAAIWQCIQAEFDIATDVTKFRRTKAEVADLWDALYAIVKAQRPMTVRQVYYLATVRGLVAKTEKGYRDVANNLTKMRRAGRLPYYWLVDNTRRMRKPLTYSSIEEVLEATRDRYRKSYWDDQDDYVEIWIEKDALSGVVYPVTAEFDVPLMVARGYASVSFLYTAAEEIARQDRPCFIYHFGDYDPSGVNAGEKIEETLRNLAPDADIHFERVAVTPQQIAMWNLPTRPTKESDPRARGFADESVELDAIPPDDLRQLVREVIELHMPAERLAELQEVEAEEKAELSALIDQVRGGLA